MFKKKKNKKLEQKSQTPLQGYLKVLGINDSVNDNINDSIEQLTASFQGINLFQNKNIIKVFFAFVLVFTGAFLNTHIDKNIRTLNKLYKEVEKEKLYNTVLLEEYSRVTSIEDISRMVAPMELYQAEHPPYVVKSSE